MMKEINQQLAKVVEMERKLGKAVVKAVVSFKSANIFSDELAAAKSKLQSAQNLSPLEQSKVIIEAESTLAKVSCLVK